MIVADPGAYLPYYIGYLELINYLEDDTTVFEKQPMQRLAVEGQLKSFYHSGFWQCMDTQREMNKLEELWQSGNAPWKIWE